MRHVHKIPPYVTKGKTTLVKEVEKKLGEALKEQMDLH